MRGAADRGARGRVRDDASAVSGPFARPFRRFVAIGVPAGIARSGYRRAGRHHAATGRPGSGRVQGASVTFVSTREAFVLGAAPCRHAPCTSIARTLDRGVSWRGLPAPVVPLGEPYASTGPAAWGIRFATPEHGFVFGNGLWVTTDGGEHWPAVAYPGGAMLSLEITGHQVLAVTARHGPDGLTGWTLSRRALGGGPWIRITALAGNSGVGGIATQAGVAAVVDGSSVLVTSNGGLTVTKHAAPCPATRQPVPGGHFGRGGGSARAGSAVHRPGLYRPYG